MDGDVVKDGVVVWEMNVAAVVEEYVLAVMERVDVVVGDDVVAVGDVDGNGVVGNLVTVVGMVGICIFMYIFSSKYVFWHTFCTLSFF